MAWSSLMRQPYALKRQGPRCPCQITQTDRQTSELFSSSSRVSKSRRLFSVVTAKINSCMFREEIWRISDNLTKQRNIDSCSGQRLKNSIWKWERVSLLKRQWNDSVLGVFLEQKEALKRDQRVCAGDTDGRIAVSITSEGKQPSFGAVTVK